MNTAQCFTKTDMRDWGTQRLRDLKRQLVTEQQSVTEDTKRDEEIGYMLQSIDELLANRQ